MRHQLAAASSAPGNFPDVSESLALALGAAISPIPLTISILLLSQPDRGRAKALAFAAGQVLALSIISVALWLLLNKTVGAQHHDSKTSAPIDIALGALLVLLAARKLFTKPKPKKQKPKKQRSLAAEFVFGAGLMAINIETLALIVASIKALATSKSGVATDALGLVLIVLIATVTATVPPLVTFAAPKQSGRALKWLNEQTTKHQRAISIGFLLFFGAYLLFKGLSG